MCSEIMYGAHTLIALQGDDEMKKYGYIRVSAKDQNIERQYAALEPFKLEEKQIYIDKESGKNFDRPGYQKMLKRLKRN